MWLNSGYHWCIVLAIRMEPAAEANDFLRGNPIDLEDLEIGTERL